jgi:putative transposase
VVDKIELLSFFMGLKYRITDQNYFHFVTFTVVNWIDLFTRSRYCDVFLDSVKFCQQRKELEVGAWVIMSSHIHMILRGSENNNLQDIIRDLKSFTSRKIKEEIEESKNESRRDWLLWMFKRAGAANSQNYDHQLWIQDNHPIQLASYEMLIQRLNYVHNNPVEAGYVTEPQNWKYSSACDYCGGTQGLLPLTMLV